MKAIEEIENAIAKVAAREIIEYGDHIPMQLARSSLI
jgi:hypothetical protein